MCQSSEYAIQQINPAISVSPTTGLAKYHMASNSKNPQHTNFCSKRTKKKFTQFPIAGLQLILIGILLHIGQRIVPKSITASRCLNPLLDRWQHQNGNEWSLLTATRFCLQSLITESN
jgi:hypothetical protein